MSSPAAHQDGRIPMTRLIIKRGGRPGTVRYSGRFKSLPVEDPTDRDGIYHIASALFALASVLALLWSVG
jgi:hypothetical protein